MTKILEKDIQKQILDYLKLKGVFCWKNNTVGIYKVSTGTYIPSHAKGVSDILGIIHGHPLAIEVKKPGGTLSADQEEFIKAFKEEGGVAIVAYSLDDVINILNL